MFIALTAQIHSLSWREDATRIVVVILNSLFVTIMVCVFWWTYRLNVNVLRIFREHHVNCV